LVFVGLHRSGAEAKNFWRLEPESQNLDAGAEPGAETRNRTWIPGAGAEF